MRAGVIGLYFEFAHPGAYLPGVAGAICLLIALALREGGELCVCDLAWISERSQTLVSHHMKQLRQQGLVSARKQGKMTMYRLTERGEVLLDAAVGELGAGR